jgi:hypothetical protein
MTEREQISSGSWAGQRELCAKLGRIPGERYDSSKFVELIVDLMTRLDELAMEGV